MMCWFTFWEAVYRDLYWSLMSSAMPEAKMIESAVQLRLVENEQSN